MQIRDYPIVIFYSREDEGYIAVPPDLEGCSAFGETLEDVIAEIQMAMQGWIEATQKRRPLPTPNSHPAMLPLLKELRALPDEVEE